MALLKSGWLWRQSWLLKRWKLNWCDLWADGSLVFYKSESRRDYQTRVSLKSSCVQVMCGLQCTGVCPPDSHPRENLLQLSLRDSSSILLCANSEDEALAWKLTIMEARRNPVLVYDPYNDSYQTVSTDGHTVYITPGGAAGGGIHHILVQGERRCETGVGEQVALGLLAGLAAGAALRSLLWMPFWFC